MKIAVCSDLHLEFGPLEIKNPGDVDILILSGDILVAKDLLSLDYFFVPGMAKVQGASTRFHEFMQGVCREFNEVIYVAGNHEHYHGDFATTYKILKDNLAYLSNLHILDKETFELNDVVFIGSTLWTDMNGGDPATLNHIRKCMNDFRIVDNSNEIVSYKTYFPDPKDNTKNVVVFKERVSKFSPDQAMVEHKKCLDYISAVYRNTPPWKTIVVVGHHTPSHKSCHPRYANDDLMNGGYHSDLEHFIKQRSSIKLWTHGHTHEKFDYKIGDCRVVCNPRGYDGYESIADDFTLKVVEI